MIAQDTGTAIVGPARADIYLGAGKEAAADRRAHPPRRPLRHAAAARGRAGRGRAAGPMSPRRPRGPLRTPTARCGSTSPATSRPCAAASRAAGPPPARSEPAAPPPDAGGPASARSPTGRPANGRAVTTASRRSKPARKPAPPLAPLERRTRLRLVRGVVEIDARIDLHGLTRHEAHDRLVRFLIQAQRTAPASCW